MLSVAGAISRVGLGWLSDRLSRARGLLVALSLGASASCALTATFTRRVVDRRDGPRVRVCRYRHRRLVRGVPSPRSRAWRRPSGSDSPPAARSSSCMRRSAPGRSRSTASGIDHRELSPRILARGRGIARRHRQPAANSGDGRPVSPPHASVAGRGDTTATDTLTAGEWTEIVLDCVPGRPATIEMAAPRIVRRGVPAPGADRGRVGRYVLKHRRGRRRHRVARRNAGARARSGARVRGLGDGADRGPAGGPGRRTRGHGPPARCPAGRCAHLPRHRWTRTSRTSAHCFGDLHVHSDDTVGTNDTRYNLTYGRDVSNSRGRRSASRGRSTATSGVARRRFRPAPGLGGCAAHEPGPHVPDRPPRRADAACLYHLFNRALIAARPKAD